VKRFKFRLAKVQSLRQQEEKVARRGLATALAAVDKCDQQLGSIEALVAQCTASTAPGSAMANMARGLMRGLEVARARTQRSKQQAEQQLDTARGIYTQRRAAARAIGNLRERTLDTWRRAVLAGERDEAEELARLARDSAERSAARAASTATDEEANGS
jgi:flagellar export protein FliJ